MRRAPNEGRAAFRLLLRPPLHVVEAPHVVLVELLRTIEPGTGHASRKDLVSAIAYLPEHGIGAAAA